jgi:uncharacterized membrane protein YidH (DUF202 family)
MDDTTIGWAAARAAEKRPPPSYSGSSPFDFSDFGARPSAGPSGTAVQSAPQARSGGFDPFAGRPAAQTRSAPSGEAFAGPVAAARTSFAVARAPLGIVAAAFTIAAIGVALCLLSVIAAAGDSAAGLAFMGWLLAGPAAIGALSWYNRVDTRRRLNSVYSAPTWLANAYWTVIITSAVGIGIGAWQLALWAGRL